MSLSLVSRLSDAFGVSGFEEEVRSLFVKELMEVGKMSVDKLGSVFCEWGEGKKVMWAAHMDEVGFMVQEMTSSGFLKFVALGGWWTHTLLSQKVWVQTRAGKRILGVIGSKPPHFLAEAQRNTVMSLESLYLDVGAESREQIEEMGISLGDPIVPFASFEPTSHPYRFLGKAFDDRLGLAALIEAMKELKEKQAGKTLPYCLVGAGTVQEEVGIRGAKTAGAKVLPDCAFILEAAPADDTPGFVPSESQGALGKGVQIRLYDPTAIMNRALVDFVCSVADKQGIDYQLTVRRSGGTDAGALHLIQEGVACVVLGVPTRSIHSHCGMMDSRDYESLVKLLVAVGQELTPERIDSFYPQV